jgi:hypothetical protein
MLSPIPGKLLPQLQANSLLISLASQQQSSVTTSVPIQKHVNICVHVSHITHAAHYFQIIDKLSCRNTVVYSLNEFPHRLMCLES